MKKEQKKKTAVSDNNYVGLNQAYFRNRQTTIKLGLA